MIEKIVTDYEKSRQDISRLQEQITRLHLNCGGVHEHYKRPDENIMCYEHAWRDFIADENLINPSGFGYQKEHSYDEHLDAVGCDNCIKARKLKTGELASAKKSFGVAKRRLSHYGKKLIKTNGE